MDYGIRGKVALITGGARGIGRATALALAAEGANVCICDVLEDVAAQTVKEIEALGVSALFVKADVGKEEDIKNLFATTAAKLGTIDILVTVAAISPKCPFDEIPYEQFLNVTNINMVGTYYLCREAYWHMKEKKWGRIVNLSSRSAIHGAQVACPDYAASKAGIIGLTKTLAKKMGPDNITVNCVAPGRINSPMTAMTPPDLAERVRQQIALGRNGEVEEVANVIAFLCSEAASYVTGTCVDIMGGW